MDLDLMSHVLKADSDTDSDSDCDLDTASRPGFLGSSAIDVSSHVAQSL